MVDYNFLSFQNYNFVFTLYLIIGVNFLVQIFSCNLQKYLLDKMYFKHIVGFFTLLFFITLAKNEPSDDEYLYFKKLGSTLLLYLIFVFSTRLTHLTFWIFIVLVCANFIIRNYMDSLDKEKFKDKLEKLEFASNILTVVSVGVMVIGFIMYYIEKRKEYGKDFDHEIFLVGVPKCKSIK